MTKRLDVPKNKWINFKKDFFVKYYNDTKLNVISLPLLFNLWNDMRNKDILHSQYIFSTTTPIALFYARLLRKPIVLSPRGALCSWCLSKGSKYKKYWLNIFIKPHLKNIYWHATAKQEEDEILAIFPNAKIKIIPNGIEYEKYQRSNSLTKEEYVQYFLKKKIKVSKIIVSMGRLQKKKGFDILIDAFKNIQIKCPESILLIAGQDEGEKEILKKQINGLNLKNKVFLIGNIEGQDKIDFLANADLFVLPSHNENFGNVYVESLAAGTPIVASKGTPWSEIEVYNCGLWVENTVNETADAIEKMLKSDRKEMSSNSKKLAKKYDWKIISEKFYNYFNSLVT